MTPSETLCINFADIENAVHRLKNVAHRTPVFTSHQADRIANAKILFKCENFQRVGAFKFRGAYNAISHLSDAQKKKGVVAFSSGNHAQAIALASRLLDERALIRLINLVTKCSQSSSIISKS